jgi:hypothetical protein
MTRIRSKLTYANLISTICLFLLLGGGAAFAASHLGKNSVGNKQLKANAVTGAKVKDGSLSGADIGGPVGTALNATSAEHATSATNSDHAADSAKLNGLPSSAFVSSGDVQRVDWTPSGCSSGCETTLLSVDGFSLEGVCSENAGSGEVLLRIAGAPAASSIYGSGVEGVSGNTAFHVANEAITGYLPLFLTGINHETADGQLILRSPAHTVAFSFHLEKSAPAACKVAGVVLAS